MHISVKFWCCPHTIHAAVETAGWNDVVASRTKPFFHDAVNCTHW